MQERKTLICKAGCAAANHYKPIYFFIKLLAL